MLKLKRVRYASLNSKRRENYNFLKVSAILADYGFTTMRLSDDWQGADFIANHLDGELFLKVQLKGRLVLDTKYRGKDIWMCFRNDGTWYLYPHDAFLKWALKNTNIGRTRGWEHADSFARAQGSYSWSGVPRKVGDWLTRYALPSQPSGLA